MPFLHAEQALLAPRKASSRMKKSMFLELEGRLTEWRVDWSLKTLDIFCQQVQYSISRKVSFSHRAHSGPSPNPSPTGRGVICEVTPTDLLTRFLDSSFSHRTHRFNRTFQPTFRAHRTPSAYRIHRTLLLMKIPIRM